MRKLFFLLFILAVLGSNAQTKEMKFGHVVSIQAPTYMSKTAGLNSSASIQLKNSVKDVYTVIIEDSKEDLRILEMNFESGKEFFDDTYADMLKDEDVKEKNTTPTIKKLANGLTLYYSDLVYIPKDEKTPIYYLVATVESSGYYYKVLSWTKAENKAKYREDFIKMAESLKEL